MYYICFPKLFNGTIILLLVVFLFKDSHCRLPSCPHVNNFSTSTIPEGVVLHTTVNFGSKCVLMREFKGVNHKCWGATRQNIYLKSTRG